MAVHSIHSSQDLGANFVCCTDVQIGHSKSVLTVCFPQLFVRLGNEIATVLGMKISLMESGELGFVIAKEDKATINCWPLA